MEQIEFFYTTSVIMVVLWGITRIEAYHDYYVITEHSIAWHLYSALEKKAWLVLAIYCSFVGKTAIYGILFYPVIRGITFWPMLNGLLKRDVFHLSDHLMEGWFKKRGIHGWWLFTFYVVFLILQYIISYQIWQHTKQ